MHKDRPVCTHFFQNHGPTAVLMVLTSVNYLGRTAFEHASGPSVFQSLMASFMSIKTLQSRRFPDKKVGNLFYREGNFDINQRKKSRR